LRRNGYHRQCQNITARLDQVHDLFVGRSLDVHIVPARKYKNKYKYEHGTDGKPRRKTGTLTLRVSDRPCGCPRRTRRRRRARRSRAAAGRTADR